MKTSLLLLAVACLMLVQLHAQSTASAKAPDEILFFGHTIRVYKATSPGFLYDILLQNKLIIHQSSNPFTGSPDGLKTQDDAIKVAKWQIVHFDPMHRQALNNNQLLPKEVARQLSIEFN